MVKKRGNMTETLEKIEENQDNWIVPVAPTENGEEIPDRLSPDWSTWLLKQFDKSELFNDKSGNSYPRVHGLRRLAQKYVGDIISSTCHCCASSSHFSAFIYTVEFNTPRGKVTFSDAADSFQDNTDEFFRIFPTALSVTRAEARALRKALGLITCSAEELGPKKYETKEQEKVVNTDENVPEKINSQQIIFIKTHCSKLNIHPWCLLNSGEKKYKNIKDISYKATVDFCKIINDWVRDKKNMDKYLKDRGVEAKPFTSQWENEILNS